MNKQSEHKSIEGLSDTKGINHIREETKMVDTFIKIELIVERAYNLGFDDGESGKEVDLVEIKRIEDELKSFVDLPHLNSRNLLERILSVIPESKVLPKNQRECGYNQCRDEIVEKIQGLFLDEFIESEGAK